MPMPTPTLINPAAPGRHYRPGFRTAAQQADIIDRLENWEMRFAANYGDPSQPALLENGSCLTITDVSRHPWTHRIPARQRAPGGIQRLTPRDRSQIPPMPDQEPDFGWRYPPDDPDNYDPDDPEAEPDECEPYRCRPGRPCYRHYEG